MKDKKYAHRLLLQNVSLSYGAMPVLQHLNLTVHSGEFVVIVGPSGCGKTTILNLLSGYIKPGLGVISREGVVRTVYQQDGLFPWLTVSENISMGLRSLKDAVHREKELQSHFDLIHLEDFKNHYPHELSGGMRQRAELARALAGDSDILLMDEPFSALDYQTR
jgi:NitT/TauT family transport system ATP-binding protein